MNQGRIIIHQNECRLLHHSHKAHILLSARERYEAFARQFTAVMRRANPGHIASYSGITSAPLGRLRGNKGAKRQILT